MVEPALCLRQHTPAGTLPIFPIPVLLVIRTSDGEVRWMEIRDYLKRESDKGKKVVKQIVSKGNAST